MKRRPIFHSDGHPHPWREAWAWFAVEVWLCVLIYVAVSQT